VIVDADFTKGDLITSFDIAPERIHVIPLGVAPVFRPAASAAELQADLASMGFEGPYVLYAGGLKPHKNVSTLLRAFAQFRHRDSARLVISGENLWVHGELAKLASDLGIKKRILSIPTNPQRLLRLYQGASVVVIPSRYEGFGLPILEAMACGTPVIGARATSIPEVMGEGGMMFDPLSIDELAGLMEKILDDPRLQLAQREYGLRNAARFSWERCGARTMEVYRTVAGQERT
jgi:glycosyltransferase involved in cell wall biosynthesis